jgi:hypothetical protein
MKQLCASQHDGTNKMPNCMIKDFLIGENGRERKPDWLPACFRIPIAAHTDRARIAVVDKWKAVAELISPAK